MTALGLGIGIGFAGVLSPYSAEAQAVFTAFTTPPSTARKLLIDTAIRSLKTTGVWTKLDVLVVNAAADSQAALINWKNPGTYNGTLVNAPTFTADHGFTGAATKYIETGFNPTAGGLNYVRDSASAFAWSLTAARVDGAILGSTGAELMRMFTRAFGDTAFLRINDSDSNAIASADGSGLFAINRSAASGAGVEQFYRNGSLFNSAGATSSAPENSTFRALTSASGDFVAGQCACYGFGSSLAAQNDTDLYAALHPYMQTVAGVA